MRIFITVGSQKFPFNRLLEAVDRLVGEGKIPDEVFAQIGSSDYVPRNFPSRAFLDQDEFAAELDRADIVLTHGGTGVIINAVKRGKKVIAVPRYAKLGEHVSDHQLEIARALEKQRCIVNVEDISRLERAILTIDSAGLVPYTSGNDSIIQLLRDFIGD